MRLSPNRTLRETGHERTLGESDVTSINVTNIDKVAPDALSRDFDTGEIVVTAAWDAEDTD